MRSSPQNIMKNKLNIITVILVIFVLIPQIAFASWWNPFSWKIFNRSSEVKIEKPITPPVDSINTSIQTKEESEKIKLETELEQAKAETAKAKAEAQKAQREAEIARKKLAEENLRKQQEEQAKPQIQNSQPVVVETWEQKEARDSAYADTKGWTSFTSTNALGEKRYYRKEGDLWVRKNSEAEAQETYSPYALLKYCMEQVGKYGGRIADCTGIYPEHSYSSPPAYTPPPSYTPSYIPSYTPSYTPPSLTSDAQSWRKELEEDKFKRSVCEKAGGIYISGSCI